MSTKPNPTRYAGYWLLQAIVAIAIGGVFIGGSMASTDSFLLPLGISIGIFVLIGIQLFRNIGYFVEDYVEFRERRADETSSEGQSDDSWQPFMEG